MLHALIGKEAADQLLAHEIRTFPGRLGIQHRDIPYTILNDIADGGIILDHLAVFYFESSQPSHAVGSPRAEIISRFQIALCEQG
jgi:hypothetical protein